MTLATTDLDAVREELASNTLRWAPEVLKIVPKGRSSGLIPLVPKPGQIALEKILEAQRAAGKPQRVIILKARQVGMSTWVQAKLVLAVTQLAHLNTLTVAHDDDALRTLFRIGDRMIRNLDPELRPEVRNFKTSEHIHFGQKGEVYDIWPDSLYQTSTAGSPESGRASTNHKVHLSEYGLYPQPEDKLIAVLQTVPNHADTLVVIESTARGHNHFKKLWDDAMSEDSEFAPFFWPWWREDEYALPLSDAERAEFRVGDTDQSPYAEEEAELVDPGPIDILSGEHVPLELEQLKWRRWAIPNNCGGKIDKFHQEYPAYPEQAFLASGAKVFEPMLVARAMAQAEQTDPRFGQGGPVRGAVVATERKMQAGRHGKVEAPKEPVFKPARALQFGDGADWRVWDLELPDGEEMKSIVRWEDGLVLDPEAQFVVGVDVAEGLPESGEGDPAYSAIEVIHHESKIQVCEYRSRVDPDLLAEHSMLTAMLFNDALLAIEKTGPGLAAVQKVWLDFHYARTYRRKQQEHRGQPATQRLGWSTDRATKPILIAGTEELLREETHGIRSRRLASELQTYVRLSTGKTVPEAEKYADLYMAWAIAQQVAHEEPLRRTKAQRDRSRQRTASPRYAAFSR